MPVHVVFCNVTSLGFVRRLSRDRYQETAGEHLQRPLYRRPHFTSCSRPHIRCVMSLAQAIFWVSIILINNGRMKDNIGISCQGKSQEVNRRCSKWNRPVNGKAWLTQTVAIIHITTHLTTLESLSLLYINQSIWQRMNTFRRSHHSE